MKSQGMMGLNGTESLTNDFNIIFFRFGYFFHITMIFNGSLNNSPLIFSFHKIMKMGFPNKIVVPTKFNM